MKIQVDEEGEKAIQSLCGVVIESVGGRVLSLVNLVLTQTKIGPPQEKEEVKKMLKEMANIKGGKKQNSKPAEAK